MMSTKFLGNFNLYWLFFMFDMCCQRFKERRKELSELGTMYDASVGTSYVHKKIS